jgi:hypothetical protein
MGEVSCEPAAQRHSADVTGVIELTFCSGIVKADGPQLCDVTFLFSTASQRPGLERSDWADAQLPLKNPDRH